MFKKSWNVFFSRVGLRVCMLESCNHDQSPWTYPETIRFCNDFTHLKISYSISKQPKRSFIVSLLPCYFLLLSKYISTLWNVLFAFSSGFLIFLYLAWPFPKPVLGGVCLKAFCRNATSNCSGHHAVWAITPNFIFTSHLQHINC